MNPIFEEDDALADSPAKGEKVRQDVLGTIKDWTFTMPNLDTSSRGFNVSPKLSKLVQILQAFKVEGDTFRGIVLGEVS
jgi:endoribonuclease Dicer